MSITIGSARHDENGRYAGGKAGDQLQKSSTNDTAGEVSMQSMYMHTKGWYILRPKSADHANKIASLMKQACNNSHIGYDQNERGGIVSKGINTTTNTECDCSSLIREVVKEATGKDPGNFTTENEASVLASTGLFESKTSYTSQSKTPLYNGDVLVTKSKGHTVAVVSGNARSGSSSSGSTSSATSSGTLDVDGEIGKLSVKRWQTVMKTTVDGTIDGQPSGCKRYWTAILSSVCKWTGGSSELVRAWQSHITSNGYACGSSGADGQLGQNTARSSQSFLIDRGFSCGSSGADGVFGSNSAKALQRWLNVQ